MVNMANLPQGKEFSLKGGVKSIARGKERSSDPALSLAAQVLISRGYNGLGSSVSHEADAHKNMLSNKILANNGLSSGFCRESPGGRKCCRSGCTDYF